MVIVALPFARALALDRLGVGWRGRQLGGKGWALGLGLKPGTQREVTVLSSVMDLCGYETVAFGSDSQNALPCTFLLTAVRLHEFYIFVGINLAFCDPFTY